MAKLLLAGFGKLARPLSVQLQQQGHQITALRRSPQTEASSISQLGIDLSDKRSVANIPDDFDQVVVTLTPDAYDDANYRKTYIESVDNLLQHFAQRNKETHFTYVSSTRVYGQKNGEWVDEDSETKPEDSRGQILLEAEQNLRTYHKKNTIIRFSGIYDSHSQRLLKQLEKPVPKSPEVYTNRIHREDCVGILSYLVQKKLADDSIESIYLGSDDDPAPVWDVLSWLAQSRGLPPPTPSSEERNRNKRCDNRKLKELGYSFKYSNYKKGYS
ncbi:SDR family oxidoreductase [Pleionea sp. CnH1-48]|uniref:SDR family oxidoreductase n=1 Tax=Pleionea sp. CnH1-48 TaxID=2954494 RepID=UPI002096EBE6|nr:SDR family oxidoreductase [Pleionea sp. CnH1-48]MCO7225687.1 SDR family oxidoreductase [Pleionea sp. CnH1-48]